jgi:hypothetical protein
MSGGRRHIAVGASVLAVTQVLAFGAGSAAASTSTHPGASAAPSPEATAPAQTTPGPPTTPAPAMPPARTAVVLSNELTTTTWAHPMEEVPIREHPVASSRIVAHTRLETEDGYPEVYLLLSSVTDATGRVWVRMRIPGRPNGRIGWVRQSALGDFHTTHWLIQISLSRRQLKAYYNGKLRFAAPVGVGKPSTPTPAGHFWIRERITLTSRSNPYWPYAFGTSDYSTLTDWPGGGVVGIHGDFGEPQLIPGDPSHGCVRMRAGDLAQLATRLQVGTPLHIVR